MLGVGSHYQAPVGRPVGHRGPPDLTCLGWVAAGAPCPSLQPDVLLGSPATTQPHPVRGHGAHPVTHPHPTESSERGEGPHSPTRGRDLGEGVNQATERQRGEVWGMVLGTGAATPACPVVQCGSSCRADRGLGDPTATTSGFWGGHWTPVAGWPIPWEGMTRIAPLSDSCWRGRGWSPPPLSPRG